MEETVEQARDTEVWYSLERQKPLPESLIWDLQRQYYAGRGANAWRQSEVPYYVTNNPLLANSYAEIVFAFLREQRRLAPDDRQGDEPLYICELGAGSGRFAFHFLRRLTRLCEQARLPPLSFRYVLTDFTQNNLDVWRVHPCFQPFFESGVLEVALFDIDRTDQLALQLSGQTLGTADLQRPLVVIANYVFDSVPQELFYVNEQCCHQCLVSLIINEDPGKLTAADLLERLQ